MPCPRIWYSQDGVLKNKLTYEIMDAQFIGQITDCARKHSGRNAFRTRLKELGFEMSETELNKAFLKFKDLADKKKKFPIGIIANDEIQSSPEIFRLELVQVSCGDARPTATVTYAPQMVKN